MDISTIILYVLAVVLLIISFVKDRKKQRWVLKKDGWLLKKFFLY